MLVCYHNHQDNKDILGCGYAQTSEMVREEKLIQLRESYLKFPMLLHFSGSKWMKVVKVENIRGATIRCSVSNITCAQRYQPIPNPTYTIRC